MQRRLNDLARAARTGTDEDVLVARAQYHAACEGAEEQRHAQRSWARQVLPMSGTVTVLRFVETWQVRCGHRSRHARGGPVEALRAAVACVNGVDPETIPLEVAEALYVEHRSLVEHCPDGWSLDADTLQRWLFTWSPA